MISMSKERQLYALRFGGILTIAGIVILVDRLSKWWVLKHMELGESRAVTGFLALTHVQNTGTAFGLFPGNNKALLLLGLMILITLLYGARGLSERGGLWGALGVALVLGGAIGNIVDRLHYGRVIDFIDFHFWPVFNLADSSITVGTICILIGLIRQDNF
jgi:signal peptidase II